jgi:membrane-bound lytic murein transglycosylase A
MRLGDWSRAGRVILLSALAALAACERAPEEPRSVLPTPEHVRLERVAFADLPGWQDDTLARALPALRRTCDKLAQRPGDAALGPDGYAGRVHQWNSACNALAGTAGGQGEMDLREVLRSHFVPFAVSGPDGHQGTITGYYEASLDAARHQHGPYQHPLYAPPHDLIKVDLGRFKDGLDGERLVGRVKDDRLVPYYGRKAISLGAIDGKADVLLWADDPVDVFFLHIQGSGVAELPSGETQRIGYAASNGRDFTAIGRALIASGALDGQDMSMQAIRDWLKAHPERADDLMHRNARYIFFREIDGAGPIGAFGVPLTSGRSLAVDPDAIPLGAPLWLATTHPASDKPLQRLVVAQDTGNAIQGTVRGDFFWGYGENALAKAGRMKQNGRYWLLLPKTVVDSAQPES